MSTLVFDKSMNIIVNSFCIDVMRFSQKFQNDIFEIAWNVDYMRPLLLFQITFLRLNEYAFLSISPIFRSARISDAFTCVLRIFQYNHPAILLHSAITGKEKSDEVFGGKVYKISFASKVLKFRQDFMLINNISVSFGFLDHFFWATSISIPSISVSCHWR